MFRNSKYVERYDDVVFELETPLNTDPANNTRQKKDGHRFVADNTGEVTPFDWFNGRIRVDFKVTKYAGGDIAENDHNGIVNGSYALINNCKVNLNGKKVYDSNDANHIVNIKNILFLMQNRQQPMHFSIWIQIETPKNDQPRRNTIKASLREKLF